MPIIFLFATHVCNGGNLTLPKHALFLMYIYCRLSYIHLALLTPYMTLRKPYIQQMHICIYCS